MEEGARVKLLAIAGDKRREYFVTVRRKAVYSTIAGPVKGEVLLESGYGSRIDTLRGSIYVLKPTWLEELENWARRGTQVIYPKDSAYMAIRAGLRHGSEVFEAGLGSGFLSASILSIICPGGKLYGYEVRREFYDNALHNIRSIGFGDCIEAYNMDVVEGLKFLDNESLDAGFLDLPRPENVLEEAWRVLKPSSPLIVFLPTVSQIERLVSAVDGDKWIVESVEELLLREWEAKPGALRPLPRMIGHTGFLVFLRRI